MGANGIYGLSGSGMDIESMVKVGMMKKQNEYDKMMQAQTIDEWTKSAYLDVNSKITTFNMSTLSQYKMSYNMNAKSAESTSSAIKVTANASAPIMNHKVEVTELSSAAYVISDPITRIEGAESTSIEIKDMLYKDLTYDEATDTYSYQVQKSNGSWQTVSGVSGKEKAFEFTISDGTAKDAASATISLTLEEVYNGTTINDLVSKINNAGTKIRASYDSVNERFSMYNTKGGAENEINISIPKNYDDENGTRVYSGRATVNFFNALNLQQSKNGSLTGETLHFDSPGKSDSIAGSDGNIRVDGVDYKTTNNNATIGGITYTALEITTEAATVSVSQDVEEIVDKVKSFVEDYNKLLSSLRDIYDEKRDSNYKPLTPAQKEAMKEEQITKWEEKAKKGLLYHDQALGKIIDEMRNAIMEPIDGIEGKYNSAYSIGISTTGQKGQLVLDETKLRKALSEDSDAVYNVFARLDDSQKDKNGNVINNPSGNGIAQRISDILVTANKTIKNIAGSSESTAEDSVLNTRMRERQTKMSDFKKTMQALEDILYKKYDTMEAMLTSLYAQMNFITSCFQQ
jgi:flagellar hook-associated protein 2